VLLGLDGDRVEVDLLSRAFGEELPRLHQVGGDPRADALAVGVHQVEHDDLVLQEVLVEADLLALVRGQHDVGEGAPPHYLPARHRGREPLGCRFVRWRGGVRARRQGPGQGQDGRGGQQLSSRWFPHGWLLSARPQGWLMRSPVASISNLSIIAWSSWTTLWQCMA